jgi:hypothetical protein
MADQMHASRFCVRWYTIVIAARSRGYFVLVAPNSRDVARNRQVASTSSCVVRRTSTRISPWLLRNTGGTEQVGADGSSSDRTKYLRVPGGECCCGRVCAVCAAGLG